MEKTTLMVRYRKVQLKVLCADENKGMYRTIKGSHSSSMICCIDNKQIQKIGTPNSKLLLSLMVKARKLSELNPDPYTFNVNNNWCSALPYQRFAGDIIKSKK